jgi:hypothetical protein
MPCYDYYGNVERDDLSNHCMLHNNHNDTLFSNVYHDTALHYTIVILSLSMNYTELRDWTILILQ